MALTYKWKLTSLKKTSNDSVNDAIVGTQWQLTGTDEDGFSGIFSGATPFDINTVDPNDFTPYEELTEAKVLKWIKAVVNGDETYKNHIDEQIQKQIDAAKYPVEQVESFPWTKK